MLPTNVDGVRMECERMRRAEANDGERVLGASESMVPDFRRPKGTTARPKPGIVNLSSIPRANIISFFI